MAELIRTQIWQAEPLEILARWRDDFGLEFDALHAADGKPLAANRHFRAPRMSAEQVAAAAAEEQGSGGAGECGEMLRQPPVVAEARQPSEPAVASPPRHPAYELAERGTEAKPELATRMEKAAELVASGKALLHDSNELGVIGTVEGYSIYATSCTCADHQYRGGWCKHRLAVRMAAALGQEAVEVPFTSEAAVQARERAERQRIAREVREFNQRDKQSWRAYCNGRYGSQRYVIKAVANGATTLPPEKWRKAYGHSLQNDNLTEEIER